MRGIIFKASILFLLFVNLFQHLLNSPRIIFRRIAEVDVSNYNACNFFDLGLEPSACKFFRD